MGMPHSLWENFRELEVVLLGAKRFIQLDKLACYIIQA